MTVTVWINPALGGAYTDGDGLTKATGYRSLYNAFVERGDAFNAAIEDYVFRCVSGVDLNGNTENGVGINIDTTSVTARALKIIVDTAGDQHTGVRNTGYRFPTRIRVANFNTAVNLQMVGISLQTLEIDGASGTNSTLDACISFDSPADAGGAIYVGGGTVLARNCAAVKSAALGFLQESNNSSPVVTLINFVAVACGTYGIQQSQGTLTVINSYSGGNTTNAYNGTMTRTNCQHSSATTFTGSTASVAYTTANLTVVTSGSENLKLPSGSALIAAGVGPSSNGSVPTFDFEGTIRGGTTTDVGIDQRTAAGATPTVTNVDDESFRVGEIGVVATVTNAGAAQNTGFLKICPTDDVTDVNGVTQTITGWTDTAITFNVVAASTLPRNTNLYLFVKNDGGLSNAAGYVVQITPPAGVLASVFLN